ncbi:hypothetical protein [Streptosporangium canum]|uniref:hypothetical protein n=1 Tax=Streptosporangium canum TaxID=324952 RepID=UPI00379A722D
MVYLRRQGPAGADPAAALRKGRAALTRTLDLLPTTGGQASVSLLTEDDRSAFFDQTISTVSEAVKAASTAP